MLCGLHEQDEFGSSLCIQRDVEIQLGVFYGKHNCHHLVSRTHLAFCACLTTMRHPRAFHTRETVMSDETIGLLAHATEGAMRLPIRHRTFHTSRPSLQCYTATNNHPISLARTTWIAESADSSSRDTPRPPQRSAAKTMATHLPDISSLSLGSHHCNKPGCQAFTSPTTHRLSRHTSFTSVSSSAGSGNDKIYYISHNKDLLAPSRAPKPRLLVPRGVAVVYDPKHYWDVCWNKRSTFFTSQRKPEQLMLLEMRLKERAYTPPGPSKLRNVMSAEED